MNATGRKACHVRLEEDERARLREILDGGRESREPRPRAGILLQAERNRDDGGHGDARIADVFGIGTAAAIERVSKQCMRDGLEPALDALFR